MTGYFLLQRDRVVFKSTRATTRLGGLLRSGLKTVMVDGKRYYCEIIRQQQAWGAGQHSNWIETFRRCGARSACGVAKAIDKAGGVVGVSGAHWGLAHTKSTKKQARIPPVPVRRPMGHSDTDAPASNEMAGILSGQILPSHPPAFVFRRIQKERNNENIQI